MDALGLSPASHWVFITIETGLPALKALVGGIVVLLRLPKFAANPFGKMKSLFCLWIVLACSLRAADYYVAQNAQGADTGANLADAHSAVWFNAAVNWSGTAGAQGKISPGDTVHLVGVFTSSLEFQGGGIAGKVITVFFEPGARFTNTRWTSGYCIKVNSSLSQGVRDYITIDGGASGVIGGVNGNPALANGIIESTECGTNKTYPNEGAAGIWLKNCSHAMVKNLVVRNMYNRVKGPATVRAGEGIYCESPNNAFTDLLIDNCIVTSCDTGIGTDFALGSARYTITNCTVTDINWGIDVGGRSTGATLQDLTVAGNLVGNYVNWDGTDDASWGAFHHDGLFVRCQDNATDGFVRGVRVYGNKFIDGFGEHATAAIYMNGGDMDAEIEIFNNIFLALDSGPTNGLLTLAIAKGSARVANNTFVGAPSGYAIATMVSGQFGGTNTKTYYVTNNVSLNCMLTYAGTMTAGAVLVQDYNIAGGTPAQGFYSYSTINSLGGYDFAAWRAAGRDVRGDNSNPMLDANYHLQTGSPAIGSGSNLSGYFTTDSGGVARNVSGGWDMGAYCYVGTVAILAPTNAVIYITVNP